MAKVKSVKTYKEVIALLNKKKATLFNFKSGNMVYLGKLYQKGKNWYYEILNEVSIISHGKEKTKGSIKEKIFKEMHFLGFKDKEEIKLDAIDKLVLNLDDDIHEEVNQPMRGFNMSVIGLLG